MWFNQAKCDIYMGTGAGTKLLKEIGNAQKSVKISSPYLSPKMVDELIWLHHQGVKVSVITSDTVHGHNGRQERSIKPLVVQNRHTDSRAIRSRKRLNRARTILQIVGIAIAIHFVYWFFSSTNGDYLFALALPAAIFIIGEYLRGKAKRTRIYSYSYSQLFPFRVFVTPDSNRINNMFVHGKIYIIDGHTAYLGSLNFTESGTRYNYETRVRVTDLDVVGKIDREFDELYSHEELVYFGTEVWGKRLFAEPLN
ncbi:phospholipase D family protein [Pricia sp. S334]|uniref:phospholipase D n=1 Tax=Pricia mediterranea TaxID=3076079 RepID=A0ABU3L543_9FLAO|nr:phospholipase D family protein [Pricia sp. S334]MDT7828383.1 phospholipase D family protein [Pricia sp. S334]